MRKNIVNYTKLLNSDKETAVRMLKEAYGLSEADISELEHLNEWNQIEMAAQMIYHGAINKGMPKKVSFSQMVPPNIAALVTAWDNPSQNIWTVGSRISEMHPATDISSMQRFRINTVTHIYNGNFIPNESNPFKNPNKQVFSYTDNLDGLKLPGSLCPDLCFLLGVFVADGNPSVLEKHHLRLSGKTTDEKFYRECLEAKLYDHFSILVKTHVKPRNQTKNHQVYGWTDVFLDIVSQGFFDYLVKDIHFLSKERTFGQLCIEKLQNTDVRSCYLGYYMGLLAAGAPISKSPRIHLQCNDLQHRFIPEIERASKVLDLPFKYSRPRDRQLTYSRTEMEKMSSYPVDFKILDRQVGLFVNPVHTDYFLR